MTSLRCLLLMMILPACGGETAPTVPAGSAGSPQAGAPTSGGQGGAGASAAGASGGGAAGTGGVLGMSGAGAAGAGAGGAGAGGAAAGGAGASSGAGGSSGSGAGGSSPFSPLGVDDLLTVDATKGNSYGSAVFERSDGAWVVVFERYSYENGIEGSIRMAVSVDHQTFGASTPLPGAPSEPFVAGPVRLVLGGQQYLYFSAGTYGGKIAGHRLTFDGTSFGELATLKVAEPSLGAMGWPHPVEGLGGKLALAYEHYPVGKLRVSVGDTGGLEFGAPASLGTGVQGRLASFATGELVYSNQDGKNGPQKAFVRLSTDGAIWSTPAPLSVAGNVHDTHPFRRADGGVDVYYISAGTGGFAVWRRAISLSGQLGIEQLVTEETAGSFTQPHPHRLADGRILLTFAEQLTSPEDTRTLAAVLVQDAPPVLP